MISKELKIGGDDGAVYKLVMREEELRRLRGAGASDPWRRGERA